MSEERNTISRGPWVDIDLNAVCANFAMIRNQAPGAETAAVVKCDAYGLGMAPIARALAEREQCSTFFVVYPEEGAALRTALNSADATIYVFGGPLSETLPLFDRFSLTPTLNTLEEATLWKQHFPNTPIGVHIDTGMNRRGAHINDVSAIANLGLNVVMAMSHLACASEPDHPMNQSQRAMYLDATNHFPGAKLSIASSGGALMGSDYHFDLLRPGIALYGGTPFTKDDKRIAPVAALRAPVVQMRDLAPGETVGYSATFTATRPTRIATIALGYGDGYPRSGANRACASINGERAPIAGAVSMDFITLDVTDLKNPPKLNDIAEFFGPNLPIFDVAQNCGMVPYDLLTGLGARVDRRYL